MELKKLFISLNPWPRISTCITRCLNRYSQRLWRKLASGELAPNSSLRDKRRAEWQQTTRPLVEEVFRKAKKEFKESIYLDWCGPSTPMFFGCKITNLDICSLTTNRMLTDLTSTSYSWGQAGRPSKVLEQWAGIYICQDHTGMIHIFFIPIELDTDDKGTPITTISRTGKEVSFFMRPKVSPEQQQRLLYGRYEPWDLTEEKLQRAVGRGVRLLLESRTGCKRSLYSWWLYKKNSQFYRGVMLGVVLSIPGSWLGSGIATIFRSIWTLLCGAY